MDGEAQVVAAAKDVRSSARRLVYGLRLSAKRFGKAYSQRRIVIFPSNQPWDPASLLRAWVLEPELEKLGWRVVVVPEALSLAQRQRVLRDEEPDVVLMQQTRHPLNDPALYPEHRCILDVDDADCLDPRHKDRIGKIARAATAIVVGNRFLAQCFRQHNPRVTVLWTSTPRSLQLHRRPAGERPPNVAWAHSDPLGYPVEAELMQRVMCEVMTRTRCTFWLFGTTPARAEDWFRPLRAAGGACLALPAMAYDDYLMRVGEVAIGLQPVCIENAFSQGKSFGKLLAYLSQQVAVVASDAVDHPLFFQSGRNGFLVENTVSSWADAIVRLVDDPGLRSTVAEAGWANFNERLTTDIYVKLLDQFLSDVIAERGR
jgi:hypothetical protein